MVSVTMVQARTLEEISESLATPLLAKLIGTALISVSQLSRTLAKIDPGSCTKRGLHGKDGRGFGNASTRRCFDHIIALS